MPYTSVLEQIRALVLVNEAFSGTLRPGAPPLTLEDLFNYVKEKRFQRALDENPGRTEDYLAYQRELYLWTFYFDKNTMEFPGVNPEPPIPSPIVRSPSPFARFEGFYTPAFATITPQSSPEPKPHQNVGNSWSPVSNHGQEEMENDSNPSQRDDESAGLNEQHESIARALARIYEAAGVAPYGLSTQAIFEIAEWLGLHEYALPNVLRLLSNR